MEIILELCLTAFIALLFSFLIAKIVSLAMGGDGGGASVSGSGVVEEEEEKEKPLTDVSDEMIMEELDFAEKLKVQSFESEKRTEFVEEIADKVDVFEAEQASCAGVDDQGLGSEERVECVEATEKVDEFEGGEAEVMEGLKVEGFETGKEVDLQADEAKTVESETGLKLDDIVAEQKVEKEEVDEIGEEVEAESETKVESEESQMQGHGEEEKEVKQESHDDDDDWEGIERSELEKVFGAAAKYVEKQGDLENDVQMELYGLHKIATEGPCREPQPMAFMVSARSKWNAWQRLGNMNPEAAMEQYVSVLSDRIPGWMEEKTDGKLKFESAEPGVLGSIAPDISSLPDQQTNFTLERNEELKSATGGGDITESRSFEKQAKD